MFSCSERVVLMFTGYSGNCHRSEFQDDSRNRAPRRTYSALCTWQASERIRWAYSPLSAPFCDELDLETTLKVAFTIIKKPEA